MDIVTWMFAHVLLVKKKTTNLMKIFAHVEEKRKTPSTKDISEEILLSVRSVRESKTLLSNTLTRRKSQDIKS